MRPLHVIPLFALLFALMACKPTVPSKYIQPGDMEDILYDYHVGQAMAQQDTGRYDAREYKRLLYLAAVLEKHGVTRAEFDSSLVFYYTRADRFEGLYKRVADRLSDKALDLGASQSDVNRYAVLTSTGDTANVWVDRKQMVLMPYPPRNRFDFELTCDTTYKKGDSFQLNLVVDYLYQGGSKDAVVNLTVTYQNDSIVSQSNHLSVSGVSQVRIGEVRGQKPKLIRGFIYLGKGNTSDKESSVLRLMFVHSIQLIRFHKQGVVDDEEDKTEKEEAKKTDVQKADSLKSDSLKTDTLRTDTAKQTVTKRVTIRK